MRLNATEGGAVAPCEYATVGVLAGLLVGGSIGIFGRERFDRFGEWLLAGARSFLEHLTDCSGGDGIW